MNLDDTLPEITNLNQLLFARKGKGGYQFDKAQLAPHLNDGFLDWFRVAKEKLIEQEEIKEFNPEHGQDLCYLEVAENPIVSALGDTLQNNGLAGLFPINSVSNVKTTHKAAVLVGSNEDQTEYLWHITKLTSTTKLEDSTVQLLSRSFDNLVREDGLKLNEIPDALVHYKTNQENPIIYVFNKKQVETLFEIDQHLKDNASQVIQEKLPFLRDYEEDIQRNKNLLNKMYHPIIRKSQHNSDPGFLREVKQNNPNLNFQLNDENELDMPEDQKARKDALLEFIKAITHHYSKTYDDRPMEGNPIKVN